MLLFDPLAHNIGLIYAWKDCPLLSAFQFELFVPITVFTFSIYAAMHFAIYSFTIFLPSHFSKQVRWV